MLRHNNRRNIQENYTIDAYQVVSNDITTDTCPGVFTNTYLSVTTDTCSGVFTNTYLSVTTDTCSGVPIDTCLGVSPPTHA